MTGAAQAQEAHGSEEGIVRRLGLLDPTRLVTSVGGVLRWGPSMAALYRAATLRHPRRPAVSDHRGTLSYGRLDLRSSAAARGLRGLGLRPGGHLGVLGRNHRDTVEINVAAAKAGLHVVHLNPAFAPPQLAEVLRREGVTGLVFDLDLAEVVVASGFDGPAVAMAGSGPRPPSVISLRDLRRRGTGRPLPLLPKRTSPVLLTSGTTGLPKGAQRQTRPQDAAAGIGLLRVIPYRHDDVFMIAAPLFHAWGLSQLMVAASLGAPVVLRPSFDPAGTVAAVVEHQATVLVAVPIMLQRILGEPDLDPSAMTSVRIVAASGSQLPVPVAEAWSDRVGDTIYNLYGSTEVGQATVATPEDLRVAPGTAGRVVPGSRVVVVDESRRPVPAGTTGRIFVGSAAGFTGYTGGGGKEALGDGLLDSGDVGHLDGDGRLFVTGRADDMIISGGENVFPIEVEDLLLADPAVADAAVVGVPDEDFGQRLAAFVVPVEGADLTEDDVRNLVAERLARHKVPRDVRFVEVLPRTGTGKVLRRRLLDGGVG